MSTEEHISKRELPLFPLPLVLFPGAMVPLHIFEERYKQMIKDCLESDKMFGISLHSDKDSWPPSLGKIGAIAQIVAVVPLDDGRMNILTIGGSRFRTSRYIGLEPYLRVEVELFHDDLDEQDPLALMNEVKSLYERAHVALKELNEEQVLPGDLPESPEEFSFAVAASINLQIDKKQALLELRSSAMRLKRLRTFLAGVIEQYELRAQIHSKAKKNGHSHHVPELMKEIDKLKED
jgi:Lon protease-like protein